MNGHGHDLFGNFGHGLGQSHDFGLGHEGIDVRHQAVDIGT